MMAAGSPRVRRYGAAPTMPWLKSCRPQQKKTKMLQSKADYLPEPIPQAIGVPHCMIAYSRIDSANQRAVNMVPESLSRSRGSCGTPQKKTMKLARCKKKMMPQAVAQEEASPLIKLVSLQNANGSWGLDSALASALGVSETDVKGKMPSEGVEPGVWATVLAVVWLHSRSAAQREEWELLEIKAVGWLRSRAGSISQLDKCLEAANALLGCSVAATVFGL